MGTVSPALSDSNVGALLFSEVLRLDGTESSVRLILLRDFLAIRHSIPIYPDTQIILMHDGMYVIGIWANGLSNIRNHQSTGCSKVNRGFIL